MQTYRIWEGERTFLPGEDTSKFTVITIVAEELGMLEDAVDYDSGRTYYVYQTENEVIINLVRWTTNLGEPHYGEIHRYGSLQEAAADFEQVLKDMRLI